MPVAAPVCATTILVMGQRQLGRTGWDFRAGLAEADAAVGPEGIADVLVGHLAVEPFGVEVATGPAFSIAVLGIVGVGDDVEEVGVAVDAADILGRTGTGAINAAGGAWRRVESEEPLELDDVPPVVTQGCSTLYTCPRR
jgi:hypothetical protein